MSWDAPETRAAIAAHNERATVLEPGETPAVDPNTAAVAGQRAELAAKAPLRSAAEQADVDGLALFDTARSPELFALTDRLDAERGAVPELRTADDLLAELDADDAAIAAIEGCLV